MALVVLNRSYSIHVYWRLSLRRDDDDIRRSSRFSLRAAPVLHVHCPSWDIDQLLRNKLPPVRRRQTTVYRYRPPNHSPHCLASLTTCADAVTALHIWIDLLPNQSQTETFVAGIRQQVAKLETSNGIAVSGSSVLFSSKQRVLGETLDEEMTFDEHNSGIVRACNYHLHALRHRRPLFHQDTANIIASSLI